MTDRRFSQFVDVETTTVANTNVVTPLTAIVVPVITYFASDYPLGSGRMRTLHPSRSVGSAMMFGYTLGCNLGSCLTAEAIPALGEILLIALQHVASRNTHRSVTCVQCLVVFAF